MTKIKVAVNGYGVIGKRVAHAVSLQDDMELVGVCDIVSDWRIKMAIEKGYLVFASDEIYEKQMRDFGIRIQGNLDELIAVADIIVDCTPKKIATGNIKKYKAEKLKFIVHGGEKHELTGHSFSAESNYETAINRESTRVVSCNTTSILRTLTPLKKAGLLKSACGTLLRRATDPWESHLGGIMNTMVPEQEIPSHQGPDAKSVDPDLDLVTMAVKVPETLSHLHYWNVQLTRNSHKTEILNILKNSSRIQFINYSDGLVSNNTIKEKYLDQGRPWGDMYEVALWQDMLKVEDDKLYYAYVVDNQAIVIPETIDAIRALTGIEKNAKKSIDKTNESLGIKSPLALKES